jgi:hypothetical protein
MERGARQGYLVAYYLFILAREVFNFMMKEATSRVINRGSLSWGLQGNIHYLNMWSTLQFQ